MLALEDLTFMHRKDPNNDDNDHPTSMSIYPEDHVSDDYGIDERDEGTMENWIKRHPEMIRPTGRQLFNVDPPLQRLMAQGLLTPSSLHFVRNYGLVPGLAQALEEWTIEVSSIDITVMCVNPM